MRRTGPAAALARWIFSVNSGLSFSPVRVIEIALSAKEMVPASMLPIYLETKDPVWAWKVGLVACFLNGVIEIAGAFIAEAVRRVTPRAALLSALAGIAITFISMDFTFKIFARPLVALLPMAIIFVAYFSHQRLPLGLPGGMLAIAVGTVLGWGLGTMLLPPGRRP